MLRNNLSYWIILIVANITVDSFAVTTSEMLNYYEASTKLLSRSSYEVQSTIAIEGIQDNIETNVKRSTKVFRDGHRISVTGKDDVMLNNGQRTSQIFTCILDSKAIVIQSTEQKSIPDLAFVDSNLSAWRQYSLAGLGGGVITEGFIFGDDDSRLFTILRENELQIRSNMENIDGYKVYVLDSTGKRGKFTVWLDPNANYLPRRIESHKSSSDLLNGRLVSSITSEGNIIQNKQLKEYNVIVDAVKIDKIGDVNLITAANVTEVRTYVDGYKITATYPFQIQNINLEPDFLSTKAFDVNLPDGTPIRNNDFPGGRFEVHQGKIVSAGTAFEEIDKQIDQLKQSQ